MTAKDELRKAGVYVLPPVAPEQPESQIITWRAWRHSAGHFG
jgi:hypothetical protein